MKNQLAFIDDVTKDLAVVDIKDIVSLEQASGFTAVHLTNGKCWLVRDPDFETLQARLEALKQKAAVKPGTKPMKFKQYLTLVTDQKGFFPIRRCWFIHQNPRKTAQEEAIAAKVIEQANPRENITGHFPWGAEQQLVLRELWVHSESLEFEWRDMPIIGAEELYSTQDGLPVPNAVKEPGQVVGDFNERLGEILGEDYREPTE